MLADAEAAGALTQRCLGSSGLPAAARRIALDAEAGDRRGARRGREGRRRRTTSPTSSTPRARPGRPKGVAIPHRGARQPGALDAEHSRSAPGTRAAFAVARLRRLGLGDLCGACSRGGELVLAPRSEAARSRRCWRVASRSDGRSLCLHVVPLQQLAELVAPEALSCPVRGRLISAARRCAGAAVRGDAADGGAGWSTSYGPTETTRATRPWLGRAAGGAPRAADRPADREHARLCARRRLRAGAGRAWRASSTSAAPGWRRGYLAGRS